MVSFDLSLQKLVMKSLCKLARTDNWLQSKIPPLLSIAFAGILIGDVASKEAYLLIANICISIFSVAVYGHLINDIFDAEEDRFNHKENLVSSLPPFARLLLCLITIITGFSPLILQKYGALPTLLLVINYILPTIYSAPPFSLKRRGVAGILMDSLGAHAIPTLFITSLFLASVEFSPIIQFLFLLSTFAWSFFLGLRGIITHQVADRQNDMAANVVTFGGSRNPKSLRRLVLHHLLPIEFAAIIVFSSILVWYYPLISVAILLYLALEYAKIKKGWKLPLFYQHLPEREDYIPFLNNEFYELWLPCALLITMVSSDLSFLFLAGIYLVLFWPGIKNRSKVVGRILVDVAKL